MIPRFQKSRASLNRSPRVANKASNRKATSSFSWQRVLVPVEFSPISSALLDYACKLTGHDAADIIVLHVVEPFHDVRDFGYGPVVWSRPNAFAMASAQAKLNALARRHLGSDRPWNVCVRSGVICEEILKAAKEMRVGVIVMATDGLIPRNPMKLAGMAARVHSRSSCPVLVLRNQLDERPPNL